MTAGGQSPDLRHWIGEIARKVLGEPNKLLSTQQQLRFGSNGSVAVEISGGKRGQWYDHEAAVGGGPWELLTVKGRMTAAEAVEWLRSELGIKFDDEEIVATYDYRDERGDLLQQVVRFEPKAFRQRRPDGKGGWTWSVKGLRRVPYRLPELIAAPADCIVFVVEGEKDVDQLTNLELVATCNAGGAAKRRNDGKPGRSKWRPELNPFFKGRDVVIVPDNDDAGRDHARSVASNLAPVAARVRLIELPNLAPKGDVSDWLDAGGTREELRRLAAEAPTFSPGNTRDVEAEIARLAAMPPIQCDRELPALAEKLGCRVPTLREEVKALRGKDEAPPGQGRPLDLPDVEPWPQEVGGAQLLDGLAAAMKKYVVITAAEADATALWLVRTHAHGAFDFNPPLWIKSSEKRSGKTRLCEALERVAARALLVSSATASSLLRVIETDAPTVIFDEVDAALKKSPEMAEVLRGLINSSFKRSAAHHLMSVPVPGGGYEARLFSMWAPLVLSGIGGLPDTVRDRAIPIDMIRKRKDEKVEPLRERDGEDLRELARKAARWTQDHMEELRCAVPTMPQWLNDRAADGWEPLFAIADLAGGKWEERARAAARALSGDEVVEDGSDRIKLLADVRALFVKREVDRLSSDDIVLYLGGLDERPWPEFRGGKPITKTQVARLLKPLRIKPGTKRLDDGRTAKGYYRAAFDDAFARYLPAIPPFQNVTASQTSDSAGFEPFLSVTPAPDVTDEKRKKASVSAECDGVTDAEPQLRRDDDHEWPTSDPGEAVWME